MYIYDSTMNRVPASGQIGVNDLASSSQSCGAPGTSARVACFDWGLASGYAYGTIPSFRSATLWPPTDPDASKLEANVKKWVDFFKANRKLFAAGNMLHIRRPDSRGYEAVAFVQPGAYSVLSGKSGTMHQLELDAHSAHTHSRYIGTDAASELLPFFGVLALQFSIQAKRLSRPISLCRCITPGLLPAAWLPLLSTMSVSAAAVALRTQLGMKVVDYMTSQSQCRCHQRRMPYSRLTATLKATSQRIVVQHTIPVNFQRDGRSSAQLYKRATTKKRTSLAFCHSAM